MRREEVCIRSVMVLLVLGAALVVSGCGAAGGASDVGVARFEFTRVSMGVPVRILLYAESREHAADAAAAAFDRIAEIDDCMSDYRPRSELMRLCENSRDGPTGWTPVSADLFAVLEMARRVSEASGGAFDASVGPLVKLWRQARRSGELPEQERREASRRRVDWRAVEIDADRRAVALRLAGMQLDLGGIAKGYAASRAVDLLRASGHPRCLVSLSGDIAAGDAPPGETGWRVALPAGVTLDGGMSSAQELLLVNAAASTSGDSQQYVEIGGVRYSHIVDPRTGLGVTSRVMCTVVAPAGEIADAVASAMCVGGETAAAGLRRAFPQAATIHWRVVGELPGAPHLHDPTRRLRFLKVPPTQPADD